jgi:hypothetical protein
MTGLADGWVGILFSFVGWGGGRDAMLCVGPDKKGRAAGALSPYRIRRSPFAVRHYLPFPPFRIRWRHERSHLPVNCS